MGLLSGEALAPLAVAVAIFLLLVDLMHRRPRWAARYPPGPVGIPGLGNLLQVDFRGIPNCFRQLRRRYGDVFSLQLAWTPVVVLNGPAVMREALVTYGDDTSDRPYTHTAEHLGFRPHAQGVIMARYGPAWREQRRFSVSTLRNFGLGKKSLEQWVTKEATCLCAAFTDHAGCPFSPIMLLNKAVGNVITSLTFGCRFEYEDHHLTRLMDLIQIMAQESAGILPQVLGSWILWEEDLYRQGCGKSIHGEATAAGLVDKVFRGQKALMALLDELVTEHRMTRDPAQPPRDLTDTFLAQVEKAKGNPESSFNDDNLRLVVADLFVAGMFTTSITLSWALLLMILHPDVQRRVQQEIDEVIGPARRPEMEDQARMPYTTAVVHEVQRFADIIPLGVPHKTSRDIEVQGFLIPKGTVLFTNLSSVLKDEAVWEKPFHFHPGHFLDAQGCFVKQEAFMPFSAGRRACLGEPLARMELFLFFTCLLQRFSFSVPAGQPRPSDQGAPASMVSPAPYHLCAVAR